MVKVFTELEGHAFTVILKRFKTNFTDELLLLLCIISFILCLQSFDQISVHLARIEQETERGRRHL